MPCLRRPEKILPSPDFPEGNSPVIPSGASCRRESIPNGIRSLGNADRIGELRTKPQKTH